MIPALDHRHSGLENKTQMYRMCFKEPVKIKYKNGSVILMHDEYETTVDSWRHVLVDEFTEQGWEFVTVDRLILSVKLAFSVFFVIPVRQWFTFKNKRSSKIWVVFNMDNVVFLFMGKIADPACWIFSVLSVIPIVTAGASDDSFVLLYDNEDGGKKWRGICYIFRSFSGLLRTLSRRLL